MNEELTKQVIRLHHQGWAVRSIANYYGENYGTVYAILKRNGYLPHSCGPRRIDEILPEVWEDIKARSANRSKRQNT